MNRRGFVAAAAAGTAGAFVFPSSAASIGSSQYLAAQASWQEEGLEQRRTAQDVVWHTVSEWGVEGRSWSDTARFYDRLPGRAEGIVREPVWNLSRHSAGMCAHFETDSAAIHVRYLLLKEDLAMPHMPATGVSGMDLYAEDAQGQSRWVNVVRPTEQSMDVTLAAELRPGLRRYSLYLPLYNGVESLDVGVDEGATFVPISPRTEKPLVFYGTSIMHGACASRPGMCIPSILGRRLNMPVVNLGFSGNGRMESEVAALLAELDPAAFIVDCVPNMNAEMIDERAASLVARLRQSRPQTPILLVEDRANTNTPFFPKRGEHHRSNRRALRRVFVDLTNDGVTNLYYLAGDDLMGSDGEASTDGSHPSDLGMVRYANAYEPALRAMLRRY